MRIIGKEIVKKVIKNRDTRLKILLVLDKVLTDKQMVCLTYYLKWGKRLNLKTPQTFNEKICWYKLYYRDPLMTKCADKYQVREYVQGKGLGHILNELYGVWEEAEDIDFDKLPDFFVLKTNNGTGTNIYIMQKSSTDCDEIRKKIGKRLSHKPTPIILGKEWAYKDIPPRIICERIIGSEEQALKGLRDYQIFCFNGVPRFIMVNLDKYQGYKRNIYDTDWTYIDTRLNYDSVGDTLEKPQKLEEMLQIARILSEDFPHVRVDLYCVEEDGQEKIYFGELTFYHGGGNNGEFDEVFGPMISEAFVLPSKYK